MNKSKQLLKLLENKAASFIDNHEGMFVDGRDGMFGFLDELPDDFSYIMDALGEYDGDKEPDNEFIKKTKHYFVSEDPRQSGDFSYSSMFTFLDDLQSSGLSKSDVIDGLSDSESDSDHEDGEDLTKYKHKLDSTNYYKGTLINIYHYNHPKVDHPWSYEIDGKRHVEMFATKDQALKAAKKYTGK